MKAIVGGKPRRIYLKDIQKNYACQSGVACFKRLARRKDYIECSNATLEILFKRWKRDPLEAVYFGWLSLNLLSIDDYNIYCEVVNENMVGRFRPYGEIFPYEKALVINNMIKAAAFMTLYNMSDRRG